MRTRYLVGGLLAAALLSSTAMAQTSQSTTPAPAATKTEAAAPKLSSPHWRSSKMIGLNVYNEQNEKLGDINEIILDKDGKVLGYVLGVGGFLGMGEHDIAVSMDKLKFMEEPVRTSSTAPATTTRDNAGAPRETTTGAATTTTAATSRSGNANDWTPDHAVMSGTKEQLKAMPQFKYSDYN
jgi:sporulation protein YlmC with PRC-barrel domain